MEFSSARIESIFCENPKNFLALIHQNPKHRYIQPASGESGQGNGRREGGCAQREIRKGVRSRKDFPEGTPLILKFDYCASVLEEEVVRIHAGSSYDGLV